MANSPVKVLKWMKYTTLFLSLVGIGLCGYSVYVSSRKEANNDYQAYCDIDESISCSKVFTSRWGKGFGFLESLLGEDSPLIVSNGVYGAIFYIIIILLGQINYDIAAKIQKYFVLLSNLMSIYLACILFFVLKDVCVICISTYIINLLITICCIVRVNYSSRSKPKKQSQKGSNTSSKNKNPNVNKNHTAKQKGQETNKSNNILQNNPSQNNISSNKSNQAKNVNHNNSNKTHQNKNATQKGNKNNSQQKNSNKSQNSKGSKRKAD